MKKVLALVLAFAMVFALVACGESGSNETKAASGKEVKVGFICLHDEQSTYDLNFINAAKQACEKLGVKYVIKTGIEESEKCLEAAEQLIEDEGCNYIFADSFGHEPYVLEAAKKYPDVQFAHATGTQAHTANVANFHDAFAAIYQGRFLVGVAAGLKLNEMIESGKITAEQAKVGYVGAFPYAEVISGYTSFYLGIRYVCPSATMTVNYTNSWYDESAEYETAKNLIAGGCVLVSQHADSMGAPRACEENGVPNVSYNGSTETVGPNTYLITSKIDWAPYFEYTIGQIQKGEAIDTDWTGTFETGSVVVLDANEKVAAKGTAEKLEQVKADLIAGKIHVFDCKTFTVGGKTLDSYLADVDDFGDYKPETEVIKDGYFHESEFRSAPYFDIIIDGVDAPSQQ